MNERLAIQDAYARWLGRKFSGYYRPACAETLRRQSEAAQARHTDIYDQPIHDVRAVACCVKHGR